MRKELADRFWRDMAITTQEEVEDVAFANPSDVARSLVKARNWTATLAQELVVINLNLKEAYKTQRRVDKQITTLESVILSRIERLPTTAVKNKETQRAFILTQATQEETEKLSNLEKARLDVEDLIDDLESEQGEIEVMRRSLERSTDWLIQYINWHKFELREL